MEVWIKADSACGVNYYSSEVELVINRAISKYYNLRLRRGGKYCYSSRATCPAPSTVYQTLKKINKLKQKTLHICYSSTIQSALTHASQCDQLCRFPCATAGKVQMPIKWLHLGELFSVLVECTLGHWPVLLGYSTGAISRSVVSNIYSKFITLTLVSACQVETWLWHICSKLMLINVPKQKTQPL